jgi:hypothetical protein
MKRPAVHLSDWACFDDTAGIHYEDSIGKPGQQGWIVCNKEERRSVLAIDIQQSVLNLGLHGHVERSCGFVRDHQSGPTDQSLRDGNTMKFTSTELMRICPVNSLHIGDPGILERRLDFLFALLAAAVAVCPYDLTNLISGTHHGA